MISDILSDAIAEIDRYRSDPATAACYAQPDIRAHVDRVRAEMEALRARLDEAPSQEPMRKLYPRPWTTHKIDAMSPAPPDMKAVFLSKSSALAWEAPVVAVASGRRYLGEDGDDQGYDTSSDTVGIIVGADGRMYSAEEGWDCSDDFCCYRIGKQTLAVWLREQEDDSPVSYRPPT